MSASLELVTGNATDVGRERSENQDYFGAWESRPVGDLWVVCDGMGGAAGGRTARTTAVEAISRFYHEAGPQVEPAEVLVGAIGEANSAVHQGAQSDPLLKGMGTTVVALLVRGYEAWVAHVGDSRVYLVHDGQLRQLTRDHTLVQNLVDGGALQAEEARDHPNSHILTKSVGIEAAVDVEVGTNGMAVSPGDRFVLCSDGLSGLVEDDTIREVVMGMEPQRACQMLVTLANERGGIDNITVQVVEAREGGRTSEGPSGSRQRFLRRLVDLVVEGWRRCRDIIPLRGLWARIRRRPE